MEFHIDCPACGKKLAVGEGAAGAHLPCACGWEVVVPDLPTLRQQAGLPAHDPPPPHVIARMMRDGELPPEGCLGCGKAAAEVVETVAECEPPWVETHGGLFVVGLLFGVIYREERETKEYGQGLTVRVPVRLCPRCRRSLTRRVLLTGLRLLTYALLLAVIPAILAIAFWVGLVLAAAAALAWAGVRAVRRSRQRAIKALLGWVPVYRRLLEIYPDAVVTDADDRLALR